MQNQMKYLIIYLSLLTLPFGSVFNAALAQDRDHEDSPQSILIDQAQLDQILAPIALYPDTLLSHILVASTYPIEVIQAARWRATNKDLNEQQVLDAVENKDWDPSVKALTPFYDLLQKLSEDLDWLQTLGSAFLANEQQLLTSVQNLRHKAYQAGNLSNNQYVQVEQQDNQIIIETVRKEVIYVPYYDTRVVYGNWWWDHHQPFIWLSPRHTYLSSGIYWGHGFSIFPRFYFGGFHWRNRHVVANYHYHTQANRHWTNKHNSRKRVRVTEYPRWSHNSKHRKGAQYRLNGQAIVVNKHQTRNTAKHIQKADKKRVLNVSNYTKETHDNASQIKQKLRVKGEYQQTQSGHKNKALNSGISNKKRLIHRNKSHNKQKVVRQYAAKQNAESAAEQNRTIQQPTFTKPNKQSQTNNAQFKNHNKERVTRQVQNVKKSSQQTHRISPIKHNKRREIQVVRRSQSQSKQK